MRLVDALSSSLRRSVRQVQAFCIKHRPIDTHTLVVPTIACLDGRRAAEADADAARHRSFQRQMAWDAAALGLDCQRAQHRFGAATEQMLWGFMRFEQVGDESAVTDAAVVGSEMDRRAGLTEILDGGCEICRSNSVVEGNPLGAAARRLSAVAACAKQLADVGQKRRLPDAAGHEADVLIASRFGK